jgi:phosphopantothenoylcysteine decarboxylase/phosphopantothenate--cysteine ligase
MNKENSKNQDLKVELIGDYLKGKSIALCVTGGIAAIESPKIARHLRRYGATVKAYTTQEALKFVGKASLEWGTDQGVVSELSGRAEHICLEDLVLVAPATLNTINKICSGIADNAVTALVASALGMKKPVYLVPTMHNSLFDNPFFQENLAKAGKYGISVLAPRVEEGKRKMPGIDEIAVQVARGLSEDKLKGKKILITGGPTPGKIDDIRRITNIFKGTLAVKIGKEAYLRGADVKLLLGKTGINVPAYLDVTYHDDYHEYRNNTFKELEKGYDVGVFSAAVADYIPVEVIPGKIKSEGTLKNIPLVQTKKVIAEVREKFPSLFMVTFKYEDDSVSHEQLMDIANKRIRQGYQLVVANRSQEMRNSQHKAYILGEKGVLYTPKTKDEIAKYLFNAVGEQIGGGVNK